MTLAYDGLQRPTQIRSVSAAGAVIMDYRYTYDAAGNVARRETEDGPYEYTYDALDRLTGATPPIGLQQSPANPNGLPVEQYTYDPVHNRKTSAHQPGAWIYDENNELTAYGTGPERQTYRYDANGNMIEQKSGTPDAPSRTRAFLYNAAERLSEVRDDGVTIARYQYDPMGRRIRKETSEGVTWFQYADEGLVAEFRNGAGAALDYGWKLGGVWGTSPIWLLDFLAGNDCRICLYHDDHLGASEIMTDMSGRIVWAAVSEAFGAQVLLFSEHRNRLAFPGQVLDSETGLFYNHGRYYIGKIGLYISSDPYGIYEDTNFWRYAKSNPLRNIDPYGSYSIDPECYPGKCKKSAG